MSIHENHIQSPIRIRSKGACTYIRARNNYVFETRARELIARREKQKVFSRPPRGPIMMVAIEGEARENCIRGALEKM